MTHRKEQVESSLKRAVAEVLAEGLSDPRIKGLTSVTRVEMSPDLRVASVYVSVIPEQYGSRNVQGLRHAAGHIQSLLRGKLRMRQLPRLEFCLDATLKKQAEVFKAIDEGMARTPPDAPERAEGSPVDRHADKESGT